MPRTRIDVRTQASHCPVCKANLEAIREGLREDQAVVLMPNPGGFHIMVYAVAARDNLLDDEGNVVYKAVWKKEAK